MEKDNTTLIIKFEENLSDNSIKMIKDILKDSLGFKTKIYENSVNEYNMKEKTLIEEIRLGEYDFYLDEIEEVFNDEGIELRDFHLCNQEIQHRIENKLKEVLEKAKQKEEKEE